MRSVCRALAIGLAVACLPAFADFTGRVVGITDGDTVQVMNDGKAVKVRLNGIDAPESRQPFGTKSKTFLSEAIAGKTVTVVEHGPDKYGRTIGDIICDGQNINHASVANGMAWWYRKYAPGDSALEIAELQAKAAGHGLWADSNPVPPWEWRKGGSSSQTGGRSSTAEKVSPLLAPPGGGTHWMTTSSGKRHNSGCRYYQNSKGRPCGPDEGTPCKICGG